MVGESGGRGVLVEGVRVLVVVLEGESNLDNFPILRILKNVKRN